MPEMTWSGLIKLHSQAAKALGQPSSLNDVQGAARKEWQLIKDGKHGKYVQGKPKKGRKGSPSITRPGHLDYRTHKGSKFYNRLGHWQRYNQEGKIGRPFMRKSRKGRKTKGKKPRKTRKRKQTRRRGLGRGPGQPPRMAIRPAPLERLSKCHTALEDARRLLTEAHNENSRLVATSVQDMNLREEIQTCRDQVIGLEEQVGSLQARAQEASAPTDSFQSNTDQKAAALDLTASLDKDVAGADADEAKGALAKAKDTVKNVASQIADVLTGAKDSVKAEAEGVEAEAEGTLYKDAAALGGGRKSRRRRRRSMRRSMRR